MTNKISKADKNGIIALYDALVPRTTMQAINVEVIRKKFPTFGDIDLDLIIEEGFPAFERTIGVENFEKVKKHFGIGYRKCFFIKNKKQNKEIEDLISSLRTIENAQYYISGYKELIAKVASKLEGAPQGFPNLVKAKMVRMYFLIYSDTHYFCEDYVSDPFNKSIRIDYERVFVNNKYPILPEELFVLYATKLNHIPDETIFFDFIHYETVNLEKKLLKEVLRISELEIEGSMFCSTNNVYPDLTFGIVRNLKMKIHPEPEEYPTDLFAMKHNIEKVEFYDLYFMYKLLKVVEPTDFEKVEKQYKRIEGSRVVDSSYTCYKLPNDAMVSGEREKERILRFVEYVAYRGFTVSSYYTIHKEDESEKYEYNAKKIFGAIMFANQAKYLSASSAIAADFKVALKFSEMDQTNALEEFYDQFYDQEDTHISVEEMKAKLGIDEAFEFEYFGIKKKLDLKEVIANFAVENGYVQEKEEIDFSIAEAIIIPANEEVIERYGEGKISTKQFVEKIGFSNEFGEMFFNLSKIDMAVIEAKLLEVKKLTTTGQKKINPKLKLLVLLYCYIIENEIPCGPKKRVAKRNKALKPSNLKMFI